MDLELIRCASATPTRSTPLLFVHGAWHGAWCWEYMLPYFGLHGYDCYALSLRGHGESAGHARINWYNARDYLADLQAAIGTLPAPPVLIGHSMGGYLVQRYLEDHTVPAAILLAPLPVMGGLGFFLRYTVRHPLAVLRTLASFDARHLVGTPGLARASFFSPDLPIAELERHAARLRPESIRMMLDVSLLRLARPRPGVPMLVIGAAADQVFTQAEITATAQAWQAELAILPDLAHDLMLDTGWTHAAEYMLEWLKRHLPAD